MKAAILTVSDRCARKEREDETGPALKEALASNAIEVAGVWVVADEKSEIEEMLRRLAATDGIDLILTNGGTGLGPRDVTPEATEAVIERRVPGIPEAIRVGSAKYTARAMLSRGVTGIREGRLIINLPGSPRGAVESVEIVLPILAHAGAMLRGEGHG